MAFVPIGVFGLVAISTWCLIEAIPYRNGSSHSILYDNKFHCRYDVYALWLCGLYSLHDAKLLCHAMAWYFVANIAFGGSC